MKKITLSIAFFACAAAMAQDYPFPDESISALYCAAGDKGQIAGPSEHPYVSSTKTYAIRKADGGLKGVSVETGVGCDIKLSKQDNKLIAHVSARRVSHTPLLFDAEKILTKEPEQVVQRWEGDVDLSSVDRVDVPASEATYGLSVVAGVLRRH